jgi:tagatose-1,6-bisphosphate aldolase
MPAEVRVLGDPDELGERERRLAVAQPFVETTRNAGLLSVLGRALWRGVLGADDPSLLLRLHSVPRLRQLGEIVDRHGRPWSG